MNQYTVSIDYLKFVFDEGEAALAFAEVARKHIEDISAEIIIEIEKIITETEEGEEDGR